MRFSMDLPWYVWVLNFAFIVFAIVLYLRDKNSEPREAPLDKELRQLRERNRAFDEKRKSGS